MKKTSKQIPLSEFQDVVQLILQNDQVEILGLRAFRVTLETQEQVTNAMSALLPDEMEEDEQVADISIWYPLEGFNADVLLAKIEKPGNYSFLYNPSFRPEAPIVDY